MKTLYISDLDGTLLNSNGALTKETIAIINRLIEKGEIFSVATARSFSRSKQISDSLHLKYPIIVYNGVFLINPISGETLSNNYFDNIENNYLKDLFKQYNITPNVYSFIDGVEKVSLVPDYNNEHIKYYLDSRKGDKRLNFVENITELYSGDIFAYLCMGEKSELQPVYDIIKMDNRFSCVFQQELNRDEYWLDINPKKATKAKASLELKQLLNCDKIIAFR